VDHRLRHGTHPAAPLKTVAEIISGRNFKSYVEPGADTPRVVQAGAVREFHLDLSSVPAISLEEWGRAGRAQLRAGDVLVTTTGLHLGRASVVGPLGHPAAASGAVTILRSSGKVDPHYLAAFLNSAPGRRQVTLRQALATAQPYIRRRDVGEILIPLPPLELQRDLGRRAHSLHADATELRRRADAVERAARDLVVIPLFGSLADE
jgi:hypothetical protein